MKKLLILLILPFIFFACSKDKDDDSNAFTKEQIIGHWFPIQYWTNGAWETVLSSAMYADFDANNKYKGKIGCTTYSGTYTISGNIIICDVSSFKVQYIVSDLTASSATLEMKYEGENETLKMKVLRTTN